MRRDLTAKVRCELWNFGDLAEPGLARGRDTHNDCPAGADRAALDRLEGLIEADFDGGEVVVAATDGETLAGDSWILHHEEVHDLIWRHGGLLRKRLEFLRDGDGRVSCARGGEEVVCRQAGAGAMCAPLMLEKAQVGVDVFVGTGV